MGQTDNLLKWFYYITAVIFFFGSILVIDTDGFNIYTLWLTIAYGVGVYLINKLDTD